MSKNLACVHYGYQIEDDKHALFDCIFAKKVWSHLPLGEKWFPISTLNFLDLIYSVLFIIILKMLLFLLYMFS